MSESNGNGYVGSEFFLGGFERRYLDVPLPAGKKARIRNLSERERVGYEERFFDPKSSRMKPDCRVGLVSMCLVNAAGEPLFPDFAGVRDKLFDGDFALTGLLFDACWKHCGFSDEDRAKLVAESFPEARADASCSV
jgi:hypothetical protein